MQRMTAQSNPNALAYRDRLITWILRIYTGAGGFPRFAQTGNANQSMVADLLGLEALGHSTTTEAQAVGMLNQAWQQHLAQHGDALAPVQTCHLQRCLQWIADCAQLTPTQHAILELVVCAQCFVPLRRALNLWDELNHGGLVHALSVLLDAPVVEVDEAIANQGRLMRCGLLSISLHGGDMLHRMLTVPEYLGRTLTYYQGEPQNVLQGFLQPLQPPRQNLNLQSFVHIQQHTDLANYWLTAALRGCAEVGVDEPYRAGHLLVSGAPGLGKTEWVRAWLRHYAEHIDSCVAAWELQVLDENGHALSGLERVRHLQMAMGMLSGMGSAAGPNGRRSVLIFDEADDAFHTAQDTGGVDRGAASMANHRASMNRLMEDSELPVIWIMNHPQVLDAAVHRRFDAVVHFKSVARSVRRKLLQERLGQHIPAQELERWADIEELTPALIDRLSRVWIRSQAHGEQNNQQGHAGIAMDLAGARHWLRERIPGKSTRHLKLSQASETPNASATTSATTLVWTAHQVNASADLLLVAAGMRGTSSGRILLYGPPGSGKTAYARHLARLLDKPLLQWRASDLLSPWVGGTEQRIAQAFDEAASDDGLLFIDEADSLMYKRSESQRSWEVSQVNELLQHLEEFEGCLVLATNRMDALDPALLRRMDIKLKFDCLHESQLLQGFKALCEKLQVPYALTKEELESLARIRQATPGDLACVARRAALLPETLRQARISPASELLAMLLEEIHTKTGGRTAMGFLNPQQTSNPASVDLTQCVWGDQTEGPTP